MHTNRKSVVIWNGVFAVSWVKRHDRSEKLKKHTHCEKRYPMHWHNFEFMCDNFSIIVLIARCSTMESFRQNMPMELHFEFGSFVHWNARKIMAINRHAELPLDEQTVISIAIIAIFLSTRNKRFSSVKRATSVSLSGTEIVALKATNLI